LAESKRSKIKFSKRNYCVKSELTKLDVQLVFSVAKRLSPKLPVHLGVKCFLLLPKPFNATVLGVNSSYLFTVLKSSDKSLQNIFCSPYFGQNMSQLFQNFSIGTVTKPFAQKFWGRFVCIFIYGLS